MLIVQELKERLTTPEQVGWKRSGPTLHFLHTLREMGSEIQDRWAKGDFQSSEKLSIAEQACCFTLLQIVTAIEELKLPEKEDGN